jgi:hypothetical protein
LAGSTFVLQFSAGLKKLISCSSFESDFELTPTILLLFRTRYRARFLPLRYTIDIGSTCTISENSRLTIVISTSFACRLLPRRFCRIHIVIPHPETARRAFRSNSTLDCDPPHFIPLVKSSNRAFNQHRTELLIYFNSW